MPEHLTYFTELARQERTLYGALYDLYVVESQDELSEEQQKLLIKLRRDTRKHLTALRKLLDTIEREHGLLESVETHYEGGEG